MRSASKPHSNLVNNGNLIINPSGDSTATLSSCTANGSIEVYAKQTTATGYSNGNASYTYQKSVTWIGPDPAPCRSLSFTATGGGSESVTVTCAVGAGCSSSVSAAGSGNCSSLGNASAGLAMQSISISAQYSGATQQVDMSGAFGATVNVNEPGASVTGSFNGSSSWSTSGTGSKSGSASYSVKADRSYNANTSSNYTRSRSGNVTITSSATAESASENGKTALGAASSMVNISI